MDEVAQDRERLVLCGVQRQSDGIAHAKAHAQMFGPNDFHGASNSAQLPEHGLIL
jgi:hypothetical protein